MPKNLTTYAATKAGVAHLAEGLRMELHGKPIHEAGSRETAFVTKGRLRLVCDGVAHDLDEGDAVTFDSDLAHHLENPGRGEAQFVSVMAAGLRRS